MTADTRPEHAPRTTFGADRPAPDRAPVENRHARPGEQFHFLKSGITFPTKPNWIGSSVVSYKSQTVTVTSDLLEAWPTLSRLLGDDDAQIERWGEVRFRPGPAPADLPVWEYGSHEWQVARETARAAAWADPDPVARARKLEALERVFGAPRSTQTSARSPGNERLVDEQRRRLDALGAVQHIKNVEIPHPRYEPTVPSDQNTGQQRG